MDFIKQFYNFFKHIIISRWLIIELTKKDFQTRYLGSYLGMLWAFINPTINVLILWFVFQVGFKSVPMDNFPFILWLVTGMFPWFFISESISSTTTSIIENSYLVKKIVFRVSILPIIKIASALVIHLFFVMVLILMFWLYGYRFSLHNLQIIYYLFATICLVLSISLITSSIIVFFRDMGHIVGMVLQFTFWLTPIFWSAKIIPIKYLKILQLNPVYYIVEGYRNTFIYHKWFWEDGFLTMWFWSITVIIFIIGVITFRRLRPHFADVL